MYIAFCVIHIKHVLDILRLTEAEDNCITEHDIIRIANVMSRKKDNYVIKHNLIKIQFNIKSNKLRFDIKLYFDFQNIKY